MTNQTEIKNFKMTGKYGYRSAPTHISDSWCPAKFESEISEKIDLERIVDNVRLKIIELSKGPNEGGSDAVFGEPFGPHGITSDKADCYVSNALYDKKNNLAAFALVYNRSWFQSNGSRSTWNRGIYGIKIDENKLKGELIDFQRGHSYASDDHFDENNSFHLDKLEDGVLEYEHYTKYSPIAVDLNCKTLYLGQNKFKFISKDEKFLDIVMEDSKENKTKKWIIKCGLKQLFN